MKLPASITALLAMTDEKASGRFCLDHAGYSAGFGSGSTTMIMTVFPSSPGISYVP